MYQFCLDPRDNISVSFEIEENKVHIYLNVRRTEDNLLFVQNKTLIQVLRIYDILNIHILLRKRSKALLKIISLTAYNLQLPLPKLLK